MTRAEATWKIGQCQACKEMTSIADPCCNAPVHYQGASYTLEDFEDEDQNEVDPLKEERTA